MRDRQKKADKKKLSPQDELDILHKVNDAINDCYAFYSQDYSYSSVIQAEAMFTWLMIHLYDALKGLADLGHRIEFQTELPDVEGVNDITDLVSKLRNAVCHVGSKERTIQKNLYYYYNVRKTPDDFIVYYGPYFFKMAGHGTLLLPIIGNKLLEIAPKYKFKVRTPAL